MKILFTADLHLNMPVRSPRTGRTAFDVFAEVVHNENPEVVVVAGDIGTPTRAAQHLTAIRQVVEGRQLAIALGNHDFWLDKGIHEEFSCLHQVATQFWREPARNVGAVLLDLENADLGDVVAVGGYGHFDLGLAERDLRVRGARVTEDIYLSGGMGDLFWNDFRYIPNCGTRLQAEAGEQVAGITSRLNAAIAKGRRILVAVHTCPWRELNGHPLRGNELDILSAYSGNSLLGKEIEKCAGSVEFLACGHTHMPVRERMLNGIPCLNVGADYGRFRGVIYDTKDQRIQWVGEPVSDEA